MKIFSFLLVLVFVFGCEQKSENEVSIYMWGGSKEVNRYFDEFVIPSVKKQLHITLNRVPIDNVKTVLQKIELEKSVNKKGNVDILWINGENFKIAKEKKLLSSPFVNELENIKYIDKKNISNFLDFSEPSDGLEAPFGRAQFVMVYNPKKVPNPPVTSRKLFEWIEKNPGRFTYPALPDFTGSAFVRELFMLQIGGYKNFSDADFEKELQKIFAKLNKIKPYLYKNAAFLPNSSALLDALFAKGEVDFTMSYNPSHAQNKIKAGDFPKGTKTFIFKNGTLANTHFLAIAFNAPNKNGAKKVINFLLSPYAQLQKAKPEFWGDGTVLDMSKLDSKTKDEFLKLSAYDSLLPQSELEKAQIPELKAKYVEKIEELWEKNVAKK